MPLMFQRYKVASSEHPLSALGQDIGDRGPFWWHLKKPLASVAEG